MQHFLSWEWLKGQSGWTHREASWIGGEDGSSATVTAGGLGMSPSLTVDGSDSPMK